MFQRRKVKRRKHPFPIRTLTSSPRFATKMNIHSRPLRVLCRGCRISRISETCNPRATCCIAHMVPCPSHRPQPPLQVCVPRQRRLFARRSSLRVTHKRSSSRGGILTLIGNRVESVASEKESWLLSIALAWDVLSTAVWQWKEKPPTSSFGTWCLLLSALRYLFVFELHQRLLGWSLLLL